MKFINYLKNHLPTKRRIIQLYAALLYNANLKGLISGEIFKGKAKYLCVPGMNCYSCPAATFSCPLGSLQNALASANKKTPYYVFGIILLYCILFGRFICGFLCPFGLIQDLLYKIKTPKIGKSRFTYYLSYLKYVLLFVLVVVVPFMYGLSNASVPAFCKYICPVGLIEGGILLLSNPNNFVLLASLDILFTLKFIIGMSIVVLTIFLYRAFCRFICPLGALYGLFNKYAIFGIKVDESKCNGCNKCIKACKVDIKHVGDHECINCGDCISVCDQKAISWRNGKFILPKNEVKEEKVETKEVMVEKKTKVQLISTIVLSLLLVSTLIYANTSGRENNPSSSTNSSNRIELNVDLYENSRNLETYSTSDFKEKVLVINFWTYWCEGCKKELPHFEEVYDEFNSNEKQIEIITIHSEVPDPKYINDDFINSLVGEGHDILFAQDKENNGAYTYYFNKLVENKNSSFPVTLFLNEDLEIVETVYKGLTKQELTNKINNVLNNN